MALPKRKTPYFLFSQKTTGDTLSNFRSLFPRRAKIFYAMKSNGEPLLLEALHKSGCGFEVSSSYELRKLKKIGVSAKQVIAGNAVMSRQEIRAFYRFGVRVFAFDSYGQLERLAASARGVRVYLRLLVDDKADSVFTMSEKFGVVPKRAAELLRAAAEMGLEPYGLSFNVGSQALNPQAWANGIGQIIPLITKLKTQGIAIQALNLGGGFPIAYDPSSEVPGSSVISRLTATALAALPEHIDIWLEPGRALSARPFTLITSVIAKTIRPNGVWLALDAGAYNALLESMSYQGSIRYRIEPLRCSDTARMQKYILTGPTCDSLDVIGTDVSLPADITEGDKLIVHDAGAYSIALSTAFNGFPSPKIYAI